MIEGAFLALYGLLLISGFFMLPAWASIARNARLEGDHDYSMVAYALALNSVGTIVIFGFRLAFGFATGNWSSVGGWLGTLILVGLIAFEGSKIMLMMVRRRHGKITTWRAYALLSGVWTGFAIIWTWRILT